MREEPLAASRSFRFSDARGWKVVLYAKLAVLAVARALGLFALARRLTRGAVRVLCYHGISLADEHRFSPWLFMREEIFRGRIAWLRRKGFRALTLDEACERLRGGALDGLSVVITFDDGWRGIVERALPVMREHGFPAVLYVATHYATRRMPVFEVTAAYFVRHFAGRPVPLTEIDARLATPQEWRVPDECEALQRLVRLGESLTDEERIVLLRRLGAAAGCDLDAMVAQGLFCYSTVEELGRAQDAGLELQLHTHRHRLSAGDVAAVRTEVETNRTALQPVARRALEHFCYPSGCYSREHLAMLRGLGIRTAVTVRPGLWSGAEPLLEIPRFVDSDAYPRLLFEAEVSGFLELARRAWRALAATRVRWAAATTGRRVL